MTTRRLDEDIVAKAPYLIWNAFVDLIATDDYAEMTPLQRIASLAFWYDAEVQNGGHFQYFENSAGRRCRETVEALEFLGLKQQSATLQSAIQVRESAVVDAPNTADEFVEQALGGTFDKHDAAYHECTPTVMQALERILEQEREEFVIIDRTT